MSVQGWKNWAIETLIYEGRYDTAKYFKKVPLNSIIEEIEDFWQIKLVNVNDFVEDCFAIETTQDIMIETYNKVNQTRNDIKNKLF